MANTDYFDKLLGRTGKFTYEQSGDKMNLVTKREFMQGTTVRVKSIESPFFRWEGVVMRSTDKDGVVYYNVIMNTIRAGGITLTFAASQLEVTHS